MTSALYLSEKAGREKLDSLTQVGSYLLGPVLGEGRFGIVFRASHQSTGGQVAVKFLKVWSVPDHARQNLIRRFELEYETGQIKSDHLIRSIDMNQVEGIPYFIMEFCEGGNLERRMQSGISPAESISIAGGILRGLNDLHRHGKIHRDLKPENVLFDAWGKPKLTDFGISGHINIQLTVVNQDDRPEQVFGSYAYMAPEQLSPSKRKNTLLPTIDIFSFGVVCYEILHGKLPFGPWNNHDDIDPYIRRAASGQIDAIDPAIDPVWQRIIGKCLVADREQRFQNTEEILSLLEPGIQDDHEAVAPEFTLQVLDGEEYGRRYTLRLKDIARLGRSTSSTENEITLTETISNYISRRHATFENLRGEIYLRDGQWNPATRSWNFSKNGTYVNGIRIGNSNGRKLYKNDVITVGNTSVKIF